MGFFRRLFSRASGDATLPEAGSAPKASRTPEAGSTPEASGAARPTRLLVGLGNPGAQYAATRHNVGFAIIDRLADDLGVAVTAPEDGALVAHAVWQGTPVVLAKPQLFMNRSGGPLAALLARYGLSPEAALVIYDDLALPIGALRLRPKGGAGGHNGVSDIIEALGSTEFPRLRVGVGDNFAPGTQVDHVLSPFAEDERSAARDAVEQATQASLAFVHEGLTAAMNQFNRRG